MKNILTNLMTSAVLLCGIVGSLEAQTIRAQAAIPFAWQVNGQNQHAGDYVVARDANSKVLRIEGSVDRKGTYLTALPGPDQNSVARLVFHRVGNQYFLAGVFGPGVAIDHLRVSAAEKEAMRAQEARDVATVFVDFNPTGN